MNIFTKSLVSIGKIIVAVALVWFTILIFMQKNIGQVYVGIVLLVFVTLPTIFVVYFKNKVINKSPAFAKTWKFLRFVYALIIILFVLIMVIGLYRLYEKNKTADAIKTINSEKITLNDVMGKNLPPVPDQKLNDSTIAGIDANGNGIRDDVELAIFKEYPNSAKIRSAELQYAQALQLELTQVFDSDTLVAVMQKEDLAFDCMGFSGPDTSLSVAKSKEKEVSDFIINIDSRKEQHAMIFEKYMTGYASLLGNECEIKLSSLSN
jgi:hypothetical protein